MGKRGGSHHSKRLTTPKSVPVVGRKTIQWMLTPRPGPHPKSMGITLGSLLRDELELGVDMREIKRAMNTGIVQVDGLVVKDTRRPVGIMDIITAGGKNWRIQVDAMGRLSPVVIDAKQAAHKLAKVMGKRTIRGNKVQITLHDGRTLLADNAVQVGASVRMSVPGFKLEEQLPLKAGVRCLVTSGKHAGDIAQLEKIIERVGSMDSEASLKAGGESFITVTKYLFVVDDQFA